jgi:hypothetical protein
MKIAKTYSHLAKWLPLALTMIPLISCTGSSGTSEKKVTSSKLAGVWTLEKRVVPEGDVSVNQRLMKLSFNADGTFRSQYKGEPSQDWISSGQGAFVYNPPLLSLYWDSGAVSNITVTERDSDNLLFHHGRQMVPLASQEPQEVFVRRQAEKGPTRSPSS